MKVKALLILPGKEVQLVKIPASIKFIKSFVGDELYKIKLNSNTILIANKNANFDEFNRIVENQIILGTFLIIAVKNNRIISLKRKTIRRYMNAFKIRKQQKKVDAYNNECLEEYYVKQREIKQKNAINNRKQIFKIAS